MKKISFSKIVDKVEGFLPREKVLLLLVSLALITCLWVIGVYNTLSNESENNNKRIKLMRSDIEQITSELESVSININKNTDKSLSKKLFDLRDESKKLTREIEEKIAQMVSPEETITLIQTLLEKNNDIKIIELKHLTSKPLFESQSAPILESGNSFQAYNHEVSLEIKSNYIGTVKFLTKLEADMKKVFWDELQYEVIKYPEAKIKILFHTISLKEGWIGV